LRSGARVRPAKGFVLRRATARVVVIPSGEAHPIGHDVEAVGLADVRARLV